jgi:DNA-directed RNA polymerase specialized sigma24 family protein
LSLPPSVSEAEFVSVTATVAKALFKRFGSIHGTADDFTQQVAVWTLESLPRFDPAAGTLDAFAYRNARNRAMNALRDRVTRRDYPCERCHSGEPCGPDSTFCKRYSRWAARNTAKANLARPLGLFEVSDNCEQLMREPAAEVAAEARELTDLIDRHLPLSLRADYLRLIAGESVPKPRRERVQEAVRSILANPGEYEARRPTVPFEEPDQDDLFDEDDEDE